MTLQSNALSSRNQGGRCPVTATNEVAGNDLVLAARRLLSGPAQAGALDGLRLCRDVRPTASLHRMTVLPPATR